jgi:hypothetical protein
MFPTKSVWSVYQIDLSWFFYPTLADAIPLFAPLKPKVSGYMPLHCTAYTFGKSSKLGKSAIRYMYKYT